MVVKTGLTQRIIPLMSVMTIPFTEVPGAHGDFLVANGAWTKAIALWSWLPRSGMLVKYFNTPCH